MESRWKQYNHAMQSTLRATILIAFLLAVAACTGTRHNIQLSDVSGGLGRLEFSPYDPLQKEPVTYTTIGEHKYDKFVKEAAALRATMVFTLHTIERFETVVAGKATPNPIDFVLAWQLVTQTLPRTAERAAYLYLEGSRLKEEASSDFFWRFYKIPKAKGALDEARENLIATRDMAPVLIERLEGLVTRIDRKKLLRQSF